MNGKQELVQCITHYTEVLWIKTKIFYFRHYLNIPRHLRVTNLCNQKKRIAVNILKNTVSGWMRKALLLKRLTELFKVLQCNQGFFPPPPQWCCNYFVFHTGFAWLKKQSISYFLSLLLKKKTTLRDLLKLHQMHTIFLKSVQSNASQIYL